jgi:uncharacterized protein (TIGR00369 family)
MTAVELASYLDEVFPQRHTNWPPIHIESLEPYKAQLRMEFSETEVRPGGTLSGPAMFRLADFGFYVCLLSMIGPVPLAVTTNMSINFLRRPAPKDLIANIRILKLGQRLAVGDIFLFSDGSTDTVAHATGTYSIPSREKR